MTAEPFAGVLVAWREVGHAPDVSDALMGISTGVLGDSQDAVEMMERPAEALADACCWSLGADGTVGWHEELPTAESLGHPVENWVARVARQRGVWPSQRAAINALVLHGASPREARSAARTAFRR